MAAAAQTQDGPRPRTNGVSLGTDGSMRDGSDRAALLSAQALGRGNGDCTSCWPPRRGERHDDEQNTGTAYDIHPDGKRFITVSRPEDAPTSQSRQQVDVVLNWFEELKRIGPSD